MLECERFKLPNGLCIVVVPMENTTTIAVSVIVKGSSRAESAGKIGISHFMEHMFFKGGKKYPTRFDIYKVVDEVGADHRASVLRERIAFFMKHTINNSLLGLDVLEDMLLYSRLPEEEMAREKNVVLEEMRTLHDDPKRHLTYLIIEKLFYPGHPLGHPIIGDKKDLCSITKEDLLEYQKNFYIPKNMVIAVAGNVRPNEMVQEIEKRFGAMTGGDAKKWELFDEKNIPSENVFLLPRKQKVQANIIMASPVCGYGHDDLYAVEILAAVLGGGVSSRFFQEMREKRGLVYDIQAEEEQHWENGLFLTHWSTKNSNINRTVKLALQECRKIRECGISDEELQRAKGYLIGSRGMEYESAEVVADDYGFDELFFGEVDIFDDFKRKINAVTKEDVLCVAQKYLQAKDIKIAISADKKFCKKDELKKILESAR